MPFVISPSGNSSSIIQGKFLPKLYIPGTRLNISVCAQIIFFFFVSLLFFLFSWLCFWTNRRYYFINFYSLIFHIILANQPRPHLQITTWEAHTDYIRYLEVHPTLPFALSASDDMSIRLWDWERQWECTQVFVANINHYLEIKEMDMSLEGVLLLPSTGSLLFLVLYTRPRNFSTQRRCFCCKIYASSWYKPGTLCWWITLGTTIKLFSSTIIFTWKESHFITAVNHFTLERPGPSNNWMKAGVSSRSVIN